MADVIEVPSIWDYLGQAIDRGVGAYQKRKGEQRDQAQYEAGVVNQLMQQGQISAEDAAPYLQKVGVTAKITPNKVERKNKALATPEATAALTPEQRVDLGIPTQNELTIQGGQAAQAGKQIQEADIWKRYANGEDLSDQEATAIGVPTGAEREAKRLMQQDPILTNTAERFIDQTITQSGGRINPANASHYGEAAYNAYIQSRMANGMGALNPKDATYARQFFDQALMNRLVQQRKLDIDAEQARSAREGRQMAREDRMFQALTGAIESARKQLDDYTTNNKAAIALLSVATPEAMQRDPNIRQTKQTLDKLNKRIQNLQSVQASAAMGKLPASAIQLLQPVDIGVDNPPAPGSSGVNISGMADAIRQRKATLNDAKALVSSGKMTSEQYNQLVTLVGTGSK